MTNHYRWFTVGSQLVLVTNSLLFPNLLRSGFLRMVASPLTLIHRLVFSMLVLPRVRRLPCARLTAATQTALIAVIDVKRAGRLLFLTPRTDVKLHNATPCLKMLKFKPDKRAKKAELLHSHEALTSLAVEKAS